MITSSLRSRFREAIAGLTDAPDELLELIQPTKDPKFGDYQANLAMPLGKLLRRSPREVATELVDRLNLRDLAESVTVAGPGFINILLREG